MAIPESNMVKRMEAIVANILNREMSAQDPADLVVLTRITGRFISHWQDEFDAFAADPENPTNPETSAFFIQKIREFGRAIMRAEGQRAARNDPDIIVAAGEAAAADFD